MAGICKRCGGTGWLWRNPEKQAPLQRARRFSETRFGRWLTRCTSCQFGIRGRKVLRGPAVL